MHLRENTFIAILVSVIFVDTIDITGYKNVYLLADKIKLFNDTKTLQSNIYSIEIGKVFILNITFVLICNYYSK